MTLYDTLFFMKSVLSLFKNMQAFSVLVGVACGAAISLVLFSYLVPHGSHAVAMFRKYVYQTRVTQEKNRESFADLYTTHTGDMKGMDHGAMGMGDPKNPYVMGAVVSEHDFLVQMKLHHEAALVMAQQVLTVPSLSNDVRVLANGILSTQTKEIAQMTAWLNAGK
jgi:hypothetical protein